MNRRNFLAGFVGALSAGAFAARRANFVFILADDFGGRDLACYGNRYFATPNIDRLAAQGARFTECLRRLPGLLPQGKKVFLAMAQQIAC